MTDIHEHATIWLLHHNKGLPNNLAIFFNDIRLPEREREHFINLVIFSINCYADSALLW